ncbi:hypothetical protein JCM6882_004566 [Rhodosporidiobolus microsporus]
MWSAPSRPTAHGTAGSSSSTTHFDSLASSASSNPLRTSTSSSMANDEGGGGDGRKRTAETAFAVSGLVGAGGASASAVRSSAACTFCRKQKMKCEGPASRPCKRCRIAQVECIFDDPAAGVSKSTTKVRSNAQAQALLERRVTTIESRLERLETAQGIDTSGTATATLTASPSPDPPTPSTVPNRSLPPAGLPPPSSSSHLSGSGGAGVDAVALQNRVTTLEAQVQALQGMLWQVFPSSASSFGTSPPSFSSGLVLPASAQPTPQIPQPSQFFVPPPPPPAQNLPPGSSASSSLFPSPYSAGPVPASGSPYWPHPSPASFASFPPPLPPPPPLIPSGFPSAASASSYSFSQPFPAAHSIPDLSHPRPGTAVASSSGGGGAPLPASPQGSASSSSSTVPPSAAAQHYPPVFPSPSSSSAVIAPQPPLYHPQPQQPLAAHAHLHPLQQQGHSPSGLEALLGLQAGEGGEGGGEGRPGTGQGFTFPIKREGQDG